jgi:hypothetical protein
MPWELVTPQTFPTLKGVAERRASPTLSGLFIVCDRGPRATRGGQLWAWFWNPIGIRGEMKNGALDSGGPEGRQAGSHGCSAERNPWFIWQCVPAPAGAADFLRRRIRRPSRGE